MKPGALLFFGDDNRHFPTILPADPANGPPGFGDSLPRHIATRPTTHRAGL